MKTNDIPEYYLKSLREKYPNGILGIQFEDIDYIMIAKLINFNELTYLWLKENISELNDKWYILVDKSVQSFRLNFYDKQDEVYFMLAFMEGIMKDAEQSQD